MVVFPDLRRLSHWTRIYQTLTQIFNDLIKVIISNAESISLTLSVIIAHSHGPLSWRVGVWEDTDWDIGGGGEGRRRRTTTRSPRRGQGHKG